MDFKWASAEALYELLIFLLRVISFRSQDLKTVVAAIVYLSGKIVSRYINLASEVCTGIKPKTNIFLVVNYINWLKTLKNE